MKRFLTFTTDDSTFFYAINDIMSVKFYSEPELSIDITTKSSGIETFTFNNLKDWNQAIEVFDEL